jgi:hypothetical protein
MRRENTLWANNAKIGVKGAGCRRRSFLIQNSFEEGKESLGSMKVTFSSYVPLSSLRRCAVLGVGDLVFLEVCKFHIVIFWTSHCTVP